MYNPHTNNCKEIREGMIKKKGYCFFFGRGGGARRRGWGDGHCVFKHKFELN